MLVTIFVCVGVGACVCMRVMCVEIVKLVYCQTSSFCLLVVKIAIFFRELVVRVSSALINIRL